MIRNFFETQRKNSTSKDWVTTVLSDIRELDLKLTFEDIEKMKKGEFLNEVKRKIECKTLKDLEQMKEKHSKVKENKHPVLKLQKYLMPNETKMNKEDCQPIFKLRSKVTAVKVNLKNSYLSYECEACKNEEETQEHVLKCKVILQMQEEDERNIPPYEKILHGSVKEKLMIAKQFSKNIKIIERLRGYK